MPPATAADASIDVSNKRLDPLFIRNLSTLSDFEIAPARPSSNPFAFCATRAV